MPTFATGTITEILAERPGLQKVRVDLGGPGPERAYVLTQLTPPVSLEDRVVVNTTAVELGLGTGGWHFVHWNLSIDGWDSPGPGHIMKLRYTSLQADTGAALMERVAPLVRRYILGDTDSELIFHLFLTHLSYEAELTRRGTPLPAVVRAIFDALGGHA